MAGIKALSIPSPTSFLVVLLASYPTARWYAARSIATTQTFCLRLNPRGVIRITGFWIHFYLVFLATPLRSFAAGTSGRYLKLDNFSR
jgi:hypothetical protein